MQLRNIIKKLIPKNLFSAIEPLGHKLEAVVFTVLSGFPARGMNVIGVTGTDGKTTTATMIAAMLSSAGHKTALLTTVNVDYADGEGLRPSPTGLTTASVKQLLSIFKRIRQNGAEWVVLEVSSHALAQSRVWGVPFSVAVLTNISHEHLDYHKTMEAYAAAKRRLFELTARNRDGLRTGIVNADDGRADVFASVTPKIITYGRRAGDIKAAKIKLTSAGSRFVAVGGDTEYRLEVHLPGDFNVYNALAAVAVGRAVGLSKKQIEQGIASLVNVPGRMERIEAGQPFEVLVDYAVTPEALKNVLTTVKSVAKGNVHLVFGATGDRDRSKRPVMGKIAAELADKIYLTDDETYTEDPQVIRDAVFSGIKAAGGEAKTAEIADRKQAIEAAFAAAKPGDAVLLTGIGHQKYRNMGGVKQPWDERAIAHETLEKLG